jgi:hypothetical protein
MNDHVLALLYLLLGNVMIVIFYVEKLTGQGLFARMLALISAVFFFVAAARVVF